ncbi:hypothetical protein F4802DRAFT_615145 [Xylaria palmicola]|nr:hypothetical protein F4802DRAFT_615145 [Xylaria palmicola]
MMGLFKKRRGRSQSSGSVILQPHSEAAYEDACYLTHTRDGKPALGRRKQHSLLEDHGFDILGQSFAVPSRKDYEGQARPLTAVSQSSGLITAPTTPRPSREARKSSDDEDYARTYMYEDPKSHVTSRKTSGTSSTGSPLRSAPFAGRAHSVDQGSLKSHQPGTYRTNLSFVGPRIYNQHPIPPPPLPPPPPPPAMNWLPMPMSYSSNAYQPMPLSGFSYNNTLTARGPSTWPNPRHFLATQPVNPLGSTTARPAAIPVQQYNPRIGQSQSVMLPHTQTIPAAYPPSIFPPPPLPPQNWPHAYAMPSGRENISQQGLTPTSNAANIWSSVGQSEKSTGNKQGNDKFEHNADMQQHLSQRIRHLHTCTGCGKKRSARFQKAHPLKRGEMPALQYCHDCLADAADADYETSDREITRDIRSKKNRGDSNVEQLSSDEGYDTPERDYKIHNKHRRGFYSARKRDRAKSFCRRHISRLNSFHRRSLPARGSISSTEEYLSSVSSPSPDLRAACSGHVAPVSQARHGLERPNDRSVQAEVQVSGLPGERRSSVGSLNAKQNSPLVSTDQKHDEANNDEKGRTIMNDGSAVPRPRRTRIPRPRPQPQQMSTDINSRLSAVADDVACIFDEGHRSPCLDTGKTIGVASMSQPVEMATLSGSSNQTTPSATRKHDKLTNAPEVVGKGVHKERSSVPRAAIPGGPSRHTRKHGVRAPTDNSQTKLPGVKSKAIPQESTEKSKGYPESDFHSTESQTPSSHDLEINRKQATGHRPLASSVRNKRRPVSSKTNDLMDEPVPVFHWSEPLTPRDAPYVSNTQPPRVASDSWLGHQTEMEWAAEEMAERDLAFAGKLFDSLSGSFDGSATSTFARASLMTSNMSIVSYNSDSEGDEDTTPFIAKGAGTRENIEHAEVSKPMRQIEFSSEKDQEQKAAERKTLGELDVPRYKHSESTTTLLSYPRNNMNQQTDRRREDEQDDDSNSDYFLMSVTSSLVGHTGHSVDGFV